MRLRSTLGISAVVVSVVMAGAIFASDAVKPGLAPGDFVSPFNVNDVTGPDKGTSLCYR